MNAAEQFLAHAGELLALGVMGWNLRTQLEVSKLVAVLHAKHDAHDKDLQDHEGRLRDLERSPCAR